MIKKMVVTTKSKDMNDDCVCPKGKCHHGRKKSNAKDTLCDKCIDLWFNIHLKHRVEKMLKPDGAESKCIIMRSLLQFLGLSAQPNPCAQTFELSLAKGYKYYKKITYEIRADNLGGESFDEKSVERYKAQYPEKAELLARFYCGVHVHTAHLTWGANRPLFIYRGSLNSCTRSYFDVKLNQQNDRECRKG